MSTLNDLVKMQKMRATYTKPNNWGHKWCHKRTEVVHIT
jgi:hypothetical protein